MPNGERRPGHRSEAGSSGILMASSNMRRGRGEGGREGGREGDRGGGLKQFMADG